ncbi:MAG: hypothetical protein HY434_00410 [Candidatus Liptonbacteria bacterium]|nr:hypothetical protein [Candidatus Liptonbacteria bacterium]
MDIFTLLKELKKIEPDRGFTLRSKNLILKNDKPAFGVWQILRSNIEFGASIALMVALVYIVLGGLSTSKIAAPLQISNLDPAGLRVEAQAIDVQIELTNLSSLRLSESTPAAAGAAKSGNKKSAGFAEVNSNSTTSMAISVDEALQRLSE